MSETRKKPSRSIYYGLFYEFFRAFTIPTVALSGALIEFWGKYPFIPTQATKKTAEFGHSDCSNLNGDDLKKSDNLFPRFK